MAKLSGESVDKRPLLKLMDEKGLLILSKAKGERTWNGFPGLGKNTQYVVIPEEAVVAPKEDGGDQSQ